MNFAQRVLTGALLALSLGGCGEDSEPPPNEQPQGPIRLAQYPGQSNLEDLEADDEAVYFITSVTPTGSGPFELNGTLHRANVGEAQQTPTVIADAPTRDFVLGPTHIYFMAPGRTVETPAGTRRMWVLYRVPKAGGAREQLAEAEELNTFEHSMVVAGQYLYWLYTAGTDPASLYRMTVDRPGNIERIATGTTRGAFNLMASTTHVYWTERRTNPGVNALVRVPLAASSATLEDVVTWPIEQSRNVPSGTAYTVLTSSGIFAGFGEGSDKKTLLRLPLEPGQGELTVIEELPNDVSGIVAHDGMLYYNPRLGLGLKQRPIAGGEPVTLLGNQPAHGRLAVSNAGLFYSSAGFINQLRH